MNEISRTRRGFLGSSALTVAAAAGVTSTLGLSRGVPAAGADLLKVGVVGFGDRGASAAAQALMADPGARLFAIGDVFADRMEERYRRLKQGAATGIRIDKPEEIVPRVDVPPDRRFVGFDAYKQVIDQVDVVLLTSTPHFRPGHLAYAVEKGVHIFAEKPVATDAPGLRRCLAAVEVARKKNIALVSGLCWRYHHPRRATMRRVLDGAIGEPVAIETIYNVGGVWGPRRTRAQVGSEMELQLRNWYYYTWLSGDGIVEQAVHALDTMAWALRDQVPLKCWGSGGRQTRTEPRYGNIYDHFNLVYEYPNDVRGYHSSRQWSGSDSKISDYVRGTRGYCDVWKHTIRGETSWRYQGPDNNMYLTEHEELFRSIRAGKPINNGVYMCQSTLLAIMGRMAAYTGKEITWEMALNSKESLGPREYAWGDLPVRPVARPGATKFF